MRKNPEYAIIKLLADEKGTVQLIGLDDYHLTLDNLYEWTSCDTIQIVRADTVKDMPHLLMCLDDNGKLLQKPVNLIATLLYGQYPRDFIVGDVTLGTSWTSNPNDEPDIYAMPYDEAKRLNQFFASLKR